MGSIVSIGKSGDVSSLASLRRVASKIGLPSAEQERFLAHFGEMPGICRQTIVPTYLRMMSVIQSGVLTPKTDLGSVRPIPIGDPRQKDYSQDIVPQIEQFREAGEQIMKKGEAGSVVLAAGMATGFGGTAKATVDAMKMARMTEEGEKLTYLDLILQDINENQKTSKGFVPSIIIVSDETKEAIEENIMNFCKKMGLKLFLLNGSAGKRATEKAYEKFKAQKPGTALLLKIVTQPSVPYISKDGKNIGDPYMKGHGDTYEILRIQAKDFIEVTGLKILQIRNIDNIGATFHEAILGFFSNETETNHRQAMVETAPKFMGDKGGTPALKKLSNTNQEVLAIWEQPEVPAAELEKFLSLSPYGDFNTNTLWLLASALMQKTEPMELPLMLSKTVGNYLKLETILGHGLASFNSFALRIDRGLRFIPFKDLFDLYWGRTDAFQLYRGRLMPCQKNGEWIRRPLGAFSKAEFPDVDTLNGSFFNFGAQDRTRGLSSFVIGGAGSGFNSNQNCSFISKCALELNGDVMIISKGEGSKLVIEGTGINDTISVENSVIVLNSGEVHVISSPVIGKVDNRVTYQLLEETLLAAGPRWTPEAIEKIATNLMYRKTHPNSTG